MLQDYLVYNDEDHEYFIYYDGKKIVIPSVTQLIKYGRMIDDNFIHPMYAENGTSIHALTELVDDGIYVPEIVDGNAHSAMVGYEQFLLDHDVEWTQTEKIIFNENLFYAGTLDRMGIIDGKETLVDIKSGNKYRWHVVQLVAYLLSGEPCECADLYLGGCSYKFHTWDKKQLDEAERAFRSIVELYWYNHPMNFKRLMKLMSVL